jgi:thiol-disulfide isomerase/thioredoxin
MSLRKLFSVAAVVMCGWGSLARADTKAGDTFPPLASPDVVSLTGTAMPKIEGQVTLVDFWASWCAPCKASFPAMTKLHADLADRGFQIVAVTIDDKAADASAFWKKFSPPFTGLHDRQHALVKQVVVPTMPTSYLVDRKGVVRFVHEGFHDATERQLRKEIEMLLAEKN